MLQILESRILIIIYGPINDNVVWITRFKNEFYMLCNELDIVKVIIRRSRWLGLLSKMQELDPCRKLSLIQKALDM